LISNPSNLQKVASYHHDHVNDVAREVTTPSRRPRPARAIASKTPASVVSPCSTHSSGHLAETPRYDARLVVGRRFEARAIDRSIDRRHARARETAAAAAADTDDARLARVRVRVRVRDAADDARERRRVDTAEAATARAFGQRPRRASSIPRRRRRAVDDDRSTTTETRARFGR